MHMKCLFARDLEIILLFLLTPSHQASRIRDIEDAWNPCLHLSAIFNREFRLI